MLYNYALVALRNIQRQLSYSLINIFGLAIGFACSMVMFLYVYNEWSYDRHFKNAERVYKVGISFFNMGFFAVGPEAMGEYLPKEFESIEAFSRVKKDNDVLLTIGDKTYNELVYYTDTSYFKIFDHKFVSGNAKLALTGPGKAVITKQMSEQLFAQEVAIGKIIEVGKEKKAFIVTAIIEDDKRSSQFKSSIWLSIDDELKQDKNWSSAGVYNYVMMKEGHDQQDLASLLDKTLEKHVFPAASAGSSMTFEDYKKDENSVKFVVTPFLDVHMKSKLLFEISAGGNETNMYTFAAISIFILVLASVNFINLTTARASRRAKEVGIRKAIGSSRNKLVLQFTIESVMISLTAMIISIGLAEVFLKMFEIISGDRLLNTLWNSGWSVVILFGFAVIVGLLSGIYPSFYLTAFNPVRVLKGNVEASSGGGFRNFLVVFQFSISICLMICSSIIVRQMSFMETKDLGFSHNNMITIDGIRNLKGQAEAFQNEVTGLPGVVKTSFHTGEPGSKAIITYYQFKTPEMNEGISFNTFRGDSEYIGLMNYHLIKGRGFDRNLASDSSAVILNESAVRALNLENPIGHQVEKNTYVIGVVSDFHWESLRNSIAPTAIILGKDFHQLGVVLEDNRAQEFLQAAEKKWKELAPEEPFKYHFVDSNFGELLQKEKIFSNAIGFFTGLAIFISCLGLYGLSAFTIQQRTKEIGVRKVLGASVKNIVLMLNRKFVWLVCVSIFIATPISIYAMAKWLEGFAYKTTLQPWLFITTTLVALFIALATVSFHSIKAGLVNPADTLKYE